MKKIVLVWFSMVATCGYAQVDTTSPYIWVEEEVTDTAKAVEIARQIVAAENAQHQKEIDLLTFLKDNNKKKVKTDEEKQILMDIAKRYEQIPTERINKGLEKGKIDKVFLERFGDIIDDLRSHQKDVNTYPYHSFAMMVVLLPKKTVTVKKDNPNYGFRWLGDYDKNKLKYNPVKEIYTSADFPQYIFRYQKMDRRSYLTVCDKEGNLLAVKYDYYADIDWSAIQKAGMKYDYANNAYDINEESAAIRKALDDWYNDQSVQQKIEVLKKELLGIMMSKQLASNLAYQTVSTAEEYTAAGIVIKEIERKERVVSRQIEELKKKLPSADIQISVNSYLKQLESDNDDYWKMGTTTVERTDGLNFLLTWKEKSMKVQQTFYFDKALNELKCRYKVLNK